MPTDQQETDEPLEFVIDPHEERAAREADAELEGDECFLASVPVWDARSVAVRAGRQCMDIG